MHHRRRDPHRTDRRYQFFSHSTGTERHRRKSTPHGIHKRRQHGHKAELEIIAAGERYCDSYRWPWPYKGRHHQEGFRGALRQPGYRLPSGTDGGDREDSGPQGHRDIRHQPRPGRGARYLRGHGQPERHGPRNDIPLSGWNIIPCCIPYQEYRTRPLVCCRM